MNSPVDSDDEPCAADSMDAGLGRFAMSAARTSTCALCLLMTPVPALASAHATLGC